MIRPLGRSRTRQRAHQSQLLSSILRSSEDAVVATDLNGAITTWSPGAERLYGYSAEEMIGGPIDVLLPPHRGDEDVSILATVFTRKHRIARVETERIAKNGSLVPVALTVSPIRNDEGSVIGLVLISRDLIERKILEAEVEYLHRHDKLTGLYCRREFEHELRRQLPYSRRYGAGGAILLFAVDGLQKVNGDFGRGAGDELLVHVAQLLTDRLRTTDTVARLGADQFAVLLPEVDAASARRVAEDLLGRVRTHPPVVMGRELAITGSIGVARFDNGAAYTVESLIASADSAVDEAARRGGNRVVVEAVEGGSRIALDA